LLKTEFAVVLLDVCMPNIDGFELASADPQSPALRAHRNHLHLGHPADQSRSDQGYERWCVDYVSVPVVPTAARTPSHLADLYRKTAALEQINRQLEQRVAERTADRTRPSRTQALQKGVAALRSRKDEFPRCSRMSCAIAGRRSVLRSTSGA